MTRMVYIYLQLVDVYGQMYVNVAKYTSPVDPPI